MDSCDWDCWSYLPQLISRIHTFESTQPCAQCDPSQLSRAYATAFVNQQPSMSAWIGTIPNRVVAHILVAISQWYGPPRANIIQYQIDDGYYLPDFGKAVFDEMTAWAKSTGCDKLYGDADTIPKQRAYKIYHHLRPELTRMSIEV